MLNIRQEIKSCIEILEKEKEGTIKPTFDNLYKLGKILETRIESLVEGRFENGKTFKYVSGKGYEEILRYFDPKVGGEHIGGSDNYQITTSEITGLGNKYKGTYAVENSKWSKEKTFINKETGLKETKKSEIMNNLGEQVINENMRCVAKLFSRATGLFWHLGLEGGNN